MPVLWQQQQPQQPWELSQHVACISQQVGQAWEECAPFCWHLLATVSFAGMPLVVFV